MKDQVEIVKKMLFEDEVKDDFGLNFFINMWRKVCPKHGHFMGRDCDHTLQLLM